MIQALETERLFLRDAVVVDQQKYHRNFVDYAVISELAAIVPWPYPDDGVAKFIAALAERQGQDRWGWAMYLKSDPAELIGNVDLRKPESADQENRGFWLARKHWGNGLMTEATDAVTDYAFNVLGFETLIFSNAVGNVRSRRIKEKSGAVLLRIEPAKFVNPDYTHREVWELTKETWMARSRGP